MFIQTPTQQFQNVTLEMRGVRIQLTSIPNKEMAISYSQDIRAKDGYTAIIERDRIKSLAESIFDGKVVMHQGTLVADTTDFANEIRFSFSG